jgi:ketosteroid isomerase-like protein
MTVNLNANLELVWAGWLDAIRRGDLDTVREALDPQVFWQGAREGLVCRDREEVLAWARDAIAGAFPAVAGIELQAVGDRTLLSVRSEDLEEAAGVAFAGEVHTVFEVRDGRIVRMQDFQRREDALRAAR